MVISHLQFRSGNQQYDVPTAVIGEGSHCFLSVLYILAINLNMSTNTICKVTIKSHTRQTFKYLNTGTNNPTQKPLFITKYHNKSGNAHNALFPQESCKHPVMLSNTVQDTAVIMNGTVAGGGRSCCVHQGIRQRTCI